MRNQVAGLFSALVFFLPAAPGDSAGPETKRDRSWLWPASYTEYYRGVIGRNAGVVMGLRLEETDTDPSTSDPAIVQLVGDYFYLRYGLPLTLEGTVTGSRMELVESNADGTITGRFSASREPRQLRFEGTWQSADGQRELPFEMNRFADRLVTKSRNGDDTWFESGMLRFRDGSPLSNFANRKLEELFSNTYNNFIESEAEIAIETSQNALEDDGIGRSAFRSISETDAVLHYASGDLLSIGIYTYAYDGGVHGNYQYESLNIALIDTKPVEITLPDLLGEDPGFEENLEQLVEEGLKKQRPDLRVPVSRLPDCFLVSPAGLVFVYSPYDLGAYGDGEFFVSITWKQLRGLTKGNIPLVRQWIEKAANR